jgi:KDO2-lipid IV(A) lauroyltransferase
MKRRLLDLRWRAEALLARGGFALLRALGPVRASNLGGAVARAIGPYLPVSRVAEANLRRAMPEHDARARAGIVRGVWENLGRTIGELPHVARLAATAEGPGWELHIVPRSLVLLRSPEPSIWVSAHMGNWEVLPRAAALEGTGVASFYRPIANPYIDAFMLRMRAGLTGADMPAFRKGAAGARQALAWLNRGGRLAMLVDQKMNDGIQCRLFGLPAMTAPAAAVFALRHRCPLVPACVERIGPARFRITCEAPLPLPATGDRNADIAALTQAINDRLESWIRARPEQWLWLHRRWPAAPP